MWINELARADRTKWNTMPVLGKGRDQARRRRAKLHRAIASMRESAESDGPTHKWRRGLAKFLRSPYFLAALAALAAIAVRLLLDPLVEGVQFITFFPAIMLIAYFYGIGPALLTAVICGVAGWYLFLVPKYSFVLERPAEGIALAGYVIVSTALAMSIGAMRTALARERHAIAELQSERDLSSSTLDAISEGYVLLDRDFRVLQINPEGARLDRRDPSEIVGKTHWEAWPGTENSELGQLYKRAMSTRQPVSLEHCYTFEAGHDAWLDMRAYPVGQGLAIFYRDITERKVAEKRQQLLVGELNHRVKNTLAIVQSLAHQTFRTAQREDALERFEGRLEALATAHNLLTRESWEAASIRDLIVDALAPFCLPERCHVAGPDLRLEPKSAVTLALAMHELATNAAKYGALSNAGGQVSVSWSAQDGSFDLVWREQGGPRVTPPECTGFGTRMIKRGLKVEFKGDVELDFEPEGVICRLAAALPRVAETA